MKSYEGVRGLGGVRVVVTEHGKTLATTAPFLTWRDAEQWEREQMSDDMATMPVPELVAGIREKIQDMQPLQALVMGLLSGRLMTEYERAEALQCKIDGCFAKGSGSCSEVDDG